MKILILAGLAASFLAMGCATPQTAATTERAEEAEVLTGSRIPRRSQPQPMKAVGAKEVEVGRIMTSQPKGVQ
jgi:hypothetical protein